MENNTAAAQPVENRKRMNARARSIPDYLDTLDGFRAMATIMVLLFHYWQQSWVGYSWKIQLGSYVFNLNLEPWITTGGLGVEILFLLSGFCLFYPVAMKPERPFNARAYAYKRFVRIIPSYLLCFLVGAVLYMGCMPWAELRFYSISDTEWWYHFVGGLFFGQTATPRMFSNPFNGVLWSLPIELEFYFIFPLVLRAFRKKPTLVMVCAFIIGESWRFYLRNVDSSNISFLMNQLPGMIDVFVGGMYAAYLTGLLKRTLKDEQKKSLAPVFTFLTIAFIMVFWLSQIIIYKSRYATAGNISAQEQMHMRKIDIIAIGMAIMCSVFASGWLRKVFGNPFTRFISTISYQLYMWHILIAMRFKEWRIPGYTLTDEIKYPMYIESWRMPYFIICLVTSLAVSILLTYCFEKPVSKLLLSRQPAWTLNSQSRLPAEIITVVAGVAMAVALQFVLRGIIQ